MKKFNLLLLTLLISVFSFQAVYAEDDFTEIGGARFITEEVLEENILPYGVRHTKLDGFTSTSLEGYDADGLGGGSELVVPGEYYPQKVNVLEVPSSDTVRVTAWANLNNHKWTLTTVRGMIFDYESKNPGWKVIGAINGDFFDIGGTGNLPYQTSGAMVSNGEFYKTTAGSTVGFTNDGRTDSVIGNETVQKTEYMKLAVYNGADKIVSEFNIEKINKTPGVNETAVYFGLYDDSHNLVPAVFDGGAGNDCYVVTDAELALPNNADDFYGRGVIASTVPQELGQGQFALVTANEDVKVALDVGVKVRCQYEYIGDYAEATDITGGGDTIMAGGEANLEAKLANRAPRTVIGRKTDGTVVMMVIDGRQSSKGMYGADHTELAAVMKSYDCVEAYNLDGGGSSTLLIRSGGELVVKNSPSDGRERTDANCLLIVVKDPEVEVTVDQMATDSLDFNIDLINNNNHDINELYMEYAGELKQIVDGKVGFSGLLPNTEYKYFLYYRNDENELVRIVSDGKQKTLKRMPKVNGITVYEDGLYYEITVLYYDPDHASIIDIATLYINEKKASFYNGEMRVLKRLVGNRLESLRFEYSYNLNDGKTVFVEIDDLNVEYYRDFEAKIQYIINYVNDYAEKIYR